MFGGKITSNVEVEHFFVDLIVLTLFNVISTTYVVHLFTEYMAKNINKDRILEHSEWYSEGTFYSLDL